MKIGIPKEIKNNEFRVGLIPSSVKELTSQGHSINIETNAGLGIGFTDEDYRAVGANISKTADDVFSSSEMIIKVKEPLASERKKLTSKHILFTYLHLAPDLEQTNDLIASKAVCIAYETVTSYQGGLPLLAPMSEVAGRMSIQAGARALEKSNQGRGVLLGGVPGVEPAQVTILGGGIVGNNAAQMAIGLGADVTIIDNNINKLRELNKEFGSRVKLLFSNKENINKYVKQADLVIGGVLIPGAAAPKLVSKELISQMKPGSAVVDVAIDQGGCFETSKPTTHENPMYIVDEVVHYCVTNMPGGVARTSTIALNNVTLPFIIDIANKGYKKALLEDENLMNGLNVLQGEICYPDVAKNHNKSYLNQKQIIEKLQ